MTYVSHARTPEELKDEVLGDIRRRIELIDHYMQTVARSASEKARLARAQMELTAMLQYWERVEIRRPKRKRKDTHGNVTLPSISTETTTRN
jgi:hypothetical protein